MEPERRTGSTDRKRLGFTLVEVLLALLLTAIVAAAIYKTLGSQQKVYKLQDESIEMQQNLRAASDIMAREIRMIGYHPANCTAYAPPAASGFIIQASATVFRFTFDTTGEDCDVFDKEDIEYYLAGTDLRRKIRFVEDSEDHEDTGTLTSNIERLEFCYLMDSGSSTTTPSNYNEIRSVEITLLVKASEKDPDPGYRNKQAYQTPCGASWGPFNDQYRRKILSTSAWCRNLGL